MARIRLYDAPQRNSITRTQKSPAKMKETASKIAQITGINTWYTHIPHAHTRTKRVKLEKYTKIRTKYSYCKDSNMHGLITRLRMKNHWIYFYKVYATKSGQENTSAEILAAVGAGLVPATMAMIVPLALGRRKRRSINDLNEHQRFQQNTYYPIVQPM